MFKMINCQASFALFGLCGSITQDAFGSVPLPLWVFVRCKNSLCLGRILVNCGFHLFPTGSGVGERVRSGARLFTMTSGTEHAVLYLAPRYIREAFLPTIQCQRFDQLAS